MTTQTSQQGSVLLECLIAVLLFSIGILTVVALQAASTRMVTESQARLEAANVAKQIVGLLWAQKESLEDFDTGACGGLVDFDSDCFINTLKVDANNSLSVPPLPSGKVAIDVEDAVATITVTWVEPGVATPHTYITKTHISE